MDDIAKRYKSRQWRKLRRAVIVRDQGLCQRCAKRGIMQRGSIVHHIIEARDDVTKFWDIDNLELVCATCHNQLHPDKPKGRTKNKKRNVVKFYANKE